MFFFADGFWNLKNICIYKVLHLNTFKTNKHDIKFFINFLLTKFNDWHSRSLANFDFRHRQRDNAK